MACLQLLVFSLFVLACAATASQRPRGEDELIQEALQRRVQWRESQKEKYEKELRAHSKLDKNRPKQPSAQPTDPDDVAALTAFYKATGGPKWANNTGWLKGDPCQEPLWFGLYCLYGRVLEIDLVYNLMTGSIPPELAKASKLQVLRLYTNNIGGELPTELFRLKSLQILDLNYNAIGGKLPESISLPNLTQLVLYDNKFQGMLPTHWDTPNLEVLALSSNNFQGPLPPAIGNLKKLTQLVLSDNMLTGSFPSEYGSLMNLQQLWLFNNMFTNGVIPNSWSGMTGLVDVQMDLLRGKLPSWIGQRWVNLETLAVQDGYLTGEFDTSFCDLRKIKILHLFNNSLSGSLPICICQMRTLEQFELSDNSFTGSIPYCIGDLSKLQYLYLSRNNITGQLPQSIGELIDVQIIDVSSNGITGSVPSSVGNLVQETVGFSVCYNKLSVVESGLENFFNHIKDYSCAMYSNPWSCPLPTEVPKECGAECSKCNSGDQHKSCSICIADSDCGWCNDGGNCLDAYDGKPDTMYWCPKQDWSFGERLPCP